MTTDSRVTQEAYDRSLPIPRAFVVTFRFDAYWWMNQEDGWCEATRRPCWVDVERALES